MQNQEQPNLEDQLREIQPEADKISDKTPTSKEKTNGGHIEGRLKEGNNKTAENYQRAEEIAETYLRLREDNAEKILQELVELKTLTVCDRAKYLSDFAKASEIEDLLYATKEKSKVIGEVKRVVSYTIGTLLIGKELNSVEAHIAVGDQFLKKYSLKK